MSNFKNSLLSAVSDFDEFCEVMKAMSEKNRSWNEVIRDCFSVFDRNETGVIMKNDFEFVLR